MIQPGYNIPQDRCRDAVMKIAAAVTGSEKEGSNVQGDRYVAALSRIADYLEDNPPVPTGKAESMDASEASTVAGVVTDLNTLIQKLKVVGVISED